VPAYKRILLKLSGEALMGDDAYGINRSTIVRMVREVQEVTLNTGADNNREPPKKHNKNTRRKTKLRTGKKGKKR